VVAAVRFAREHGLPLSVRGGGHAVAGHVDRETQLRGLAVTGGFISHTGIGGLTLGGASGT
jgi:riboflavin synthase alpha subunit